MPKTDAVFEALGANDELSSHLGLAQCHLQAENLETLRQQLNHIQCDLQDINSHVASAKIPFKADPTLLEQWIDAMDEQLPELKRFILPSGGLASAQLHVARTVCRRAERRMHAIIPLFSLDPQAGVYLNRLSDYLFTAARYACQQTGNVESCKE